MTLYKSLPTAWSECSKEAHTIKRFLNNPCQPKAIIRLRKSDHIAVRNSFRAYGHIVAFRSYQPKGCGGWYIDLQKLISYTSSANSHGPCDCSSYLTFLYKGDVNLCALKKTAPTHGNVFQDRKSLQIILQLLPPEKRPLQASSAPADELECLGEKNSVDQRFKEAARTGNVIELLDDDEDE